MEFGVFYLPSIGNKAEIMQGMAGRRTDLYQRMLRNLALQAQYLDAHGYYGVAFTEHHFHVEGEETSTNPIMLDLFIGLQTENLRVGQLGIVLPCHHPIRVAEDVAMLDQMTQGRAFVGFARGYQPRWVNTLGQHYDTLADSATDPDRYEALKKELYEEHFEIIRKAWTQPTFQHRGKHWQIPPPNIHWAAHEVTRTYGRGVDEKGMLTEIGIVPEPYQKPHPPLFQPFSFSESSVRWAAQRGIAPITVVCDPAICLKQFRACQAGAAEVGRNLALGQGIGLAREVVVADTDEEAMELGRNGGCFIWTKFFEPFGFNAALARPDEDWRTIPNTFESMCERGLTICGSPDTVARKIEQTLKKLPAEYFWLFTYNELIPQKALMRSFELLTEKVLPHFSDKIS
jgi:alkanesulfonate monooxygenase SsuD/methylene tetrahydromethanopterin reductase-like flavin-dependent oxidoreductase (luciferase family)